MKHLKKFNEATDNFEQELKEFCENNLAYLLDEGQLLVQSLTGHIQRLPRHIPPRSTVVDNRRLIKVQLHFDQVKDWDEIKDQMIPFLIRLTNQYEVVEKNKENVDIYIFTLKNSGGDKVEFRIKDLIEDNVEITDIEQIRLFVQE